MTSIRIPFQKINLHLDIYRAENHRPGVLLIPGTGSYAGFYREFLEIFTRMGKFNVFAVDLPGHGRSGGKRGHFDMATLISAISQVITYEKDNWNGPVGLLGTSLGGEFAFYTALADSRVQSLLCHNLLLSSELSLNRKIRFLNSTIGRLFLTLVPDFPFSLRWALPWEKVFNNPETLKQKMADPYAVWYYSIKSFASIFTYRSPRSPKELTIPILLAVGEKDAIVGPEYTRKVFDLIGGRKQMIVLPGATHQLVVDYPQEFAKLAWQWFNQTLH